MFLLFLIAALALGQRTARAQGAEYDLTVIAIGTSPAPTRVAVSYSHAVGHAALQAAVTELGRLAGRPVEGLVLQDAPLYPHSPTTSTAAEFTAPGFITPGAPLPVAALLRALPEWRHVRIAFITGAGFRFAGPGDGTVIGGYHARLFASASTYEYDVEKTRVGTAPPPMAAPPGTQPRPAPRKARPPTGGIVALVVLLSLATLVAVRARTRSPRRAK